MVDQFFLIVHIFKYFFQSYNSLLISCDILELMSDLRKTLSKFFHVWAVKVQGVREDWSYSLISLLSVSLLQKHILSFMLSLSTSVCCIKSARNFNIFQNDIMIPSSSLMRVSNNPRAYLLLLLEYSVFLLGDYHFWNDLEKKSVQISVLVSKHVPLILSCIFITFISYLINF